jgi:hypothetical protein
MRRRIVVRLQQLSAGLGVLILGACASPPAQRPYVVFASAAAPVPRPAAASAASGGAMPPAVNARPVLAPAPPVLNGPPVTPAIAARFPEPVVSFATPAFEPGRTAYTTNDEMAAILHGLERSGVDSVLRTDVAVLPLGQSQSGLPIEALAFKRPPPPRRRRRPPPRRRAARPS